MFSMKRSYRSSTVNRSRSNRPSLRLLAVALAAFVMLGLVDGALGVAWPSLRETFGRDISDLGVLLAFGSVGYLTASGGYGWLHRRVGTGSLLLGGSILLVFGLAGFALSSEWLTIAASAISLGLGGGLVDTGMNAHAALAFDVGSINLLHACYGVGATLGPIVITVSLVSSGAWRRGYSLLAVAQVLTAFAIWTRRTRWAGAEPDFSGDATVVARRGQMWLMILLFFLYTGAEVATGQWAFTLLSEGRGMSTAAAGTWVAVYWGGLTVGRFGFGMLGGRLSPTLTLGGSMVVALAGVALIWLDPLDWGAVGLPLAGLGFAAVFPTLVALTPARIGRVRSTQSIGYQLAAANIGAAGVPWVLGGAAATWGVEALAPGLFVVAALLAALHFVSHRRGD
jgi:fucose permease